MRLLRDIRFGSQIFTHKLTGVGLLLTRRCNLACPYCNVVRQGSRETLTVAEWCRIIDRFYAHRHRHFVLTGGEPLLVDGVYDIIAHTRPKALVSLITNGLLLDRPTLRRLVGVDFLTVSFDHLRAGEGSGKHAGERLELLRWAVEHLGHDIQTITTITRDNLSEAPDVIERTLAAGLSAMISVIHADPPERAAPHEFRRSSPGLTPQTAAEHAAVDAMVARLLVLKDRYPNFVESRGFLRGIPDFLQGRYQMDCYAADAYFEVNNDGAIMACHDTPPSAVNALTFDDYDAMKAEVRRTITPRCTCYYNCYYNYARLRRHPARAVLELAARRVRL